MMDPKTYVVQIRCARAGRGHEIKCFVKTLNDPKMLLAQVMRLMDTNPAYAGFEIEGEPVEAIVNF